MKTKLLTILVAVSALFFVGCSDDVESQPPIRPVRALKVGDTAGFSDRWFPGRARGTEEVNLSFRVAGEINSLPIIVGKPVGSGEVLATLDDNFKLLDHFPDYVFSFEGSFYYFFSKFNNYGSIGIGYRILN